MKRVFQSSGKNYRFSIDDYFELYPFLEKEYEFHGNCPITGENDGLILIEYPLQIKLPYLEKLFWGDNFIRIFFKFLRDKKIKISKRHLRIKLENKKAEHINDKLKELSKEIMVRARSILNNNKETITNYMNCDFEICADFYLNENHRLFHPDSENILCQCSEFFTFDYLKGTEPSVLENSMDWNDTCFYRTFKHCYLFHEIFDHFDVNLKDLMQVDTVCIDFNLLFQNNYSFSIKSKFTSGEFK